MPTKINPNYKPSERVYVLLEPFLGSVESAREFVGHELGAFMMYWEGRDDKAAAKANWDSTCLNWMKRVYENKKEQMALHRPATPNQGDIFAAALEGLNKPEPVPIARTYRVVNTPIPGDGETMSAADALDQLAKMGK